MCFLVIFATIHNSIPYIYIYIHGTELCHNPQLYTVLLLIMHIYIYIRYRVVDCGKNYYIYIHVYRMHFFEINKSAIIIFIP